MKIALIGQSHGVALLDGIGDWRGALQLDAGRTEPGYTEAFRGWFSVNTGGRMFRMQPHPGFEALAGMEVCLLNQATFNGQLAVVKGALPGGGINIEMSPTLIAFIQQVQGADLVISATYGSEHNYYSLVSYMPLYDFAPYDDPPVGQPVDGIYMDAVLTPMGLSVAAPLACLRRALPAARLIHVPPPPPLFDPMQATSLEAMREHIERHGLSRPSLRRKWHAAYLEKTRLLLQPFAVEVLEADAAVVCRDGYLKPEYAEGLTHGNRAYGRLLAQRLLQTLAHGN